MNIETTPELILAAAAKCPQAKEALKTLFPKVFEKDIDLLKAKGVQWIDKQAAIEYEEIAMIRVCDKTKFFLYPRYNWKIEDGYLIPTRK